MKHLPIQSEEYNEFLIEFKKSLRTKGYARASVANYPSMVREFFFFLESKAIDDIRKVRAQDVITYYEYLQERPNQKFSGTLSDSMIRHQMVGVRMVFDFLVDIGILEGSPCRLPRFVKMERTERKVLTREEIKKIYDQTENERDVALMSIAYGTGLRRSEMEKLNIVDVNLHRGFLTVRNGKNNKTREVPLSDKVIADLRAYIQNQRLQILRKTNSYSDAFFLSDLGKRMRGEALNDRIKKLVQKTQDPRIIAKKVSLHTMRHSIATHLMDNGADISFVQEFLGHALIDTSHLYAKRRKLKQKYGRI